jgi:hypothetical protein
MAYSTLNPFTGTVHHLRGISQGGPSQRGFGMKVLRSHAFRAAMVLSALASSALVLEAGKRWL